MPDDSPDDLPPSDSGATTGGVADEGGCGCQSSTGRHSPWGPFAATLLGLLALRSRRRSHRSLVAMATLGGLGLFAPACGDDSPPPVDAPPPTTTDALDTDTDTDTDGLPLAPDPRLFGTFHTSYVYPGWSTEQFPEDTLGLYGHRLISLSPDGQARVEIYRCFGLSGGVSSEEDFLRYDEHLSWTFVPESGGLLIEPGDQENPSEWLAAFESMIVVLDPECEGSLSVTATFETNTNTYTHRPGRLCAEFSDLKTCRYTLDWCDEGEPGPLCP